MSDEFKTRPDPDLKPDNLAKKLDEKSRADVETNPHAKMSAEESGRAEMTEPDSARMADATEPAASRMADATEPDAQAAPAAHAEPHATTPVDPAPTPNSKKPGSEYTRREFLAWGGAAALTPLLQQRQVIRPVQKKTVQLVTPPSFTLSYLRPDDLLNLDFEFINLKLNPGNPPTLVRQNAGSPAYLIVHFPPQSIAEEAFYEVAEEFNAPGKSDPLRPPPVFSRISGRSRLAFRIPDSLPTIPYTLESLLAWDLLEPSLVPVALPPVTLVNGVIRIRETATGTAPAPATVSQPATSAAPKTAAGKILTTIQRITDQSRASQPQSKAQAQVRAKPPTAKLAPLQVIPKIAEPAPTQTSIEMPYRLIISPDARETWRHSPAPVTYDGRTELWHTRLAPLPPADGSDAEPLDAPLYVRAVWSPDCNVDNVGQGPKHVNVPFRMSLDPQDRHEIVHLSSNYFLKKPNQTPLEPEPVDVKRLMLSPLGAWLDSQGLWQPPAPLEVQEWRHRATMGRDHYVKVVYKGYLLPFGNQASLVKVTERRFWKRDDGQQIAYSFQRMFIVVRKPERTIPVPFQADDGRELPFRRIRITTVVTPTLNKPEESAVLNYGQAAFWPRVGNADFPFHVVAEDWSGGSVEFETPMLFVGNSCAYDASKMKIIVANYNDATPVDRRRPPLRGQTIAFAAQSTKGETTLETDALTFAVKTAGPNASPTAFEMADQPLCFPLLEEASTYIPALKGLAGVGATRIAYPGAYVKNGLGGSANKGELFARILDPPTMSFAANRGDKAGGVASPSFSVAGLSRVLGPVGSSAASDTSTSDVLNDVLGGTFNPTKIFNDSAKLLGGILLKDIIGLVNDFIGSPSKALVIKNETVEENGAPVAVKTLMRWQPDLHDASIFIASRAGHPAALTIDATQIVHLNGQPPTYEIRGELTNFTLDLVKGIMSFVRVMFASFVFTAKSGQKADVSPDFSGLEFLGALKFIKELLDKIQPPGSSGFGQPIVDIGSSGARLGYTFGIPSVGFGVFSLQNIRFTTEITLPFNGDPLSLRFAFNERSSPFLLSVAMFGGGGFFAMVLTSEKIQLIEGSLEFGGSFSMNIGVASGGVSLMAGIYFKYEEGEVTITGYVRCTGSLDVLGIISISAEFYMSLTYDSAKNSVYGQASLTVKIKILFFSAKVTLKVEREFAHSPAPLFCDVMDQSHWLSYCEAFA
jgi:hypothetical protein